MGRDTRTDFYPAPVVNQNTRPGAIARLIVFIVVLTAAAIVFGLFRERLGEPFLLGMLGVLAMIGVGFLFAAAIGFIQVAPRSTADDLARAFVDLLTEGLLVTDAKGRVLYANRAYAAMTGASSAADLRTLEGLLSDVSEAAPVVFRLASGLRDGQAGDGEFRLQQAIRPAPTPAPAGTGSGRAPSRSPTSASRCLPGSSPTSPRSGPNRSASSSICRRRSTISTRRRPAFWRPMPTAASPISTRPWRNGWASIWRASRRARRPCRRSSPATAWR